jgi:hypothetical protein
MGLAARLGCRRGRGHGRAGFAGGVQSSSPKKIARRINICVLSLRQDHEMSMKKNVAEAASRKLAVRVKDNTSRHRFQLN